LNTTCSRIYTKDFSHEQEEVEGSPSRAKQKEVKGNKLNNTLINNNNNNNNSKEEEEEEEQNNPRPSSSGLDSIFSGQEGCDYLTINLNKGLP
jgi:hypothetical protein